MTGILLDFNAALTQTQLEENLRRTTVDADDIRTRLNANPEAFLKWMYSGRALISRGEARIGDTSGAAGGSLSVSLRGASAGLWHDHATGEGGDLVGLYMAYMGYGQSGFGQALKEVAAEFLGDPIDVKRPSWEESAARRIEVKAKTLGTAPRADMVELGPKVADWKYRDLHGNIIASVARYEPDGPASKTYRPFCYKIEDGKPVWRMGAPTLRPLYRLPEIVTSNAIVLVEGEKCAQALADLGIDATTAMQGAHSPVEKTDWSPIQGKTIVIWPDNDAPGQEYATKVADHLRAIGCEVSIVEIPAGKPEKWDAADCVEEGSDPRAILRTAVKAEPTNLYKLYTLEELENLPPPVWLIDGMMIENGLCLFWAGSDNYKTFVAIDISMSIATGTSWHGREVQGGPVVYVAAEDLAGVKLRMVGWRETKGRGLPRPDVTLLNDSFTMASPDAEKLVRSIQMLPEKPRLIVIDTLARTFGAGNEDKTSDMNAFIQGCDLIRRATGATVMVVHHTGRNTEQERGNVSLRGACDVIFTVQRQGKSGKIKLINSPPKGKQKNAEPFHDIQLRMQQVRFGAPGNEQSTLVVMADDGAPPSGSDGEGDDELEDAAPRLGQIEKSILAALQKGERNGRDSMGFTTLHLEVKGDKGSFNRALNKLAEKGLIVKTDQNGTAIYTRVK